MNAMNVICVYGSQSQAHNHLSSIMTMQDINIRTAAIIDEEREGCL